MDISLIERAKDSFQQGLTQEQILNVCERGLGQVPVKAIQELGAGLFNNTYIIETENERVILRVAPAKGADVFRNEEWLMRREYAIQPYLSPVAQYIPKTLFADFTHQLIERDYVFQSFIQGEVWEDIRETLPESENLSLWYQVGEIAKQICSVTSDTFGFPAPKPTFKQWSGFMVNFLEGMHQDLVQRGKDIPQIAAFVERVKACDGRMDAVTVPRLVHGDLWPRNILVKKDGEKYVVCGVLDSERAYWGDEVSEWIHYLAGVPQAYWDGYGELFEGRDLDARKLIYQGVYHVQCVMECVFRFNCFPEYDANRVGEIGEQLRTV